MLTRAEGSISSGWAERHMPFRGKSRLFHPHVVSILLKTLLGVTAATALYQLLLPSASPKFASWPFHLAAIAWAGFASTLAVYASLRWRCDRFQCQPEATKRESFAAA